jgi:hypothetical protein
MRFTLQAWASPRIAIHKCFVESHGKLCGVVGDPDAWRCVLVWEGTDRIGTHPGGEVREELVKVIWMM